MRILSSIVAGVRGVGRRCRSAAAGFRQGLSSPRPGRYCYDRGHDVAAESSEQDVFADIARDYIVVEVAIYPESRVPFDVAASDFALRVGQKVGRADQPSEVFPWQEKRDAAGRLPVEVTAETGAVYGRSNDPLYGPGQGPGTYSRVGGLAPPPNDIPSPPDPRTDPRVLYDKIQRFALPEGMTKTAIAGYLYFPQYSKRKKSDEIELKYAKDASEVDLLLASPKP